MTVLSDLDAAPLGRPGLTLGDCAARRHATMLGEGAIVGTTVPGSPNSFLCSDRFFGDYELEFDVKLYDDEMKNL